MTAPARALISMLEKAVASVLQNVLGQFIEGIDSHSLQLSIWQGNIALSSLNLNAKAIDALNLPIAVLGGTVGEVCVEVPWKALRSKPIVVRLSKLYVLLASKNVGEWNRKVEEERMREAKRAQLEVWEAMEREKGVFAAMGERLVDQLVQVGAPSSGLALLLPSRLPVPFCACLLACSFPHLPPSLLFLPPAFSPSLLSSLPSFIHQSIPSLRLSPLPPASSLSPHPPACPHRLSCPRPTGADA